MAALTATIVQTDTDSVSNQKFQEAVQVLLKELDATNLGYTVSFA